MNIIAKRVAALNEIARFFESEGFDKMDTGGHGEAYVKEGKDGQQLVATSFDGMDLPTVPNDGLAIAIYPSVEVMFSDECTDCANYDTLDSIDQLKTIVSDWAARV